MNAIIKIYGDQKHQKHFKEFAAWVVALKEIASTL